MAVWWHPKRLSLRKALPPGEALALPVGLWGGVIVIVVCVAAAWWSHHFIFDNRTLQHDAEVRRVARAMAAASSRFIADQNPGGLEAVTRSVSSAFDLQRAVVVLGDGVVFVDTDAPLSTLDPQVAETRSLPRADVPPTDTRNGNWVTLPIELDKGPCAYLHVLTNPTGSVASTGSNFSGIGLIALAAMASLWLAYRDLRSRMRPLGLIHDSLDAMAGGESPSDAHRVNETLGRDAQSWNRLLDTVLNRQRAAVLESSAVLPAAVAGDSRLSAACDNLAQGLLLIDDALRLAYANGAAMGMLGLDRRASLPAPLTQLVKDEQITSAAAGVLRERSRAGTVLELDRICDNQPLVIRVSIRYTQGDYLTGVVILIEDLTQQRRADRSRNAFIAQATHELRTPLTNMRLYLETALDEGTNDAKLRGECLNVVNQECRRLEAMVGDMLSVSEMEAGSLKLHVDDIRLDALFETLQHDFKAHAKDSGLLLAFDLPPKMPVIQGDREKLTQALHNLIGNALKYTNAGGSVTVHLEATASQLNVEVRDTGIGIAPHDQEKIFEKFYRAGDERVTKKTGSGLGLALARDVARLHGGDITLNSELNKGSTFTLTLPIRVEGV